MWVSLKNDVHSFSIRHRSYAETQSIEIHGFADDTENAFGACVYLRSIDYSNKSTCILLCSITRVVPLKTIPRLELCAALISAELVNKVVSISKLKTENIF